MPKTLILIPSRMSATRLPGKPLLKINNLSIISHVVNKAKKTAIGRVVVCAEDQSIFDDVIKNGGEAILTGDYHKSGTDRIFEGYKKLNISDVDYIVNIQGDEPALVEQDIIKLNNLMIKNDSDIGTLAAEIKDEKMFSNKNIVKVRTEKKLDNKNFLPALSFISLLKTSRLKWWKNIFTWIFSPKHAVKELYKSSLKELNSSKSKNIFWLISISSLNT